jgi:hypothetical protein
MKKIFLKFIVLLFPLVLLVPISGFAQDDEEPPPGEGGDIPLDGGISLLLAAGAAYGAKKVYEFRKQEDKE